MNKRQQAAIMKIIAGNLGSADVEEEVEMRLNDFAPPVEYVSLSHTDDPNVVDFKFSDGTVIRCTIAVVIS